MNKRPSTIYLLVGISARAQAGQSGLECARTHAMFDRTYIVRFTRLKYASVIRCIERRGPRDHIVC